jgi:hypothetical protein
MNQEKVRHAAAATEVILEGCNRALQALQAPLVYNAAGMLADPSMVRSKLASGPPSTRRSRPCPCVSL